MAGSATGLPKSRDARVRLVGMTNPANTPARDDASETPDAETILVVDDEAPVREVMVLALRSEGYNVLHAANGQEALSVAERHAAPIDAIVSDIMMPLMGGGLLLENLRRWYPGIRFLLVSGFPEGHRLLGGLTGTPTSFLAKPFAPDELLRAVRELLDRPRRAPAG